MKFPFHIAFVIFGYTVNAKPCVFPAKLQQQFENANVALLERTGYGLSKTFYFMLFIIFRANCYGFERLKGRKFHILTFIQQFGPF